MSYLKLSFPKYIGLESQYEHIVYNYLDNTLKELGYILKIKKTNFKNIDKNIGGSCDAYVFSENNEKGLYALIELESNKPSSKLSDGIIQLRKYASLLSKNYNLEKYATNNRKLKLICYDGQTLYFSEYDLETRIETILIGNIEENTGELMSDNVQKFIFNNFPQLDLKKIEQLEKTEKSLIKKTKNYMRANEDLQNNKTYLLTVLASIYGQTKIDDYEESIEELKKNISDGSLEAKEINNKWEKLKQKIDYNKNKAVIKNLYEEVAIDLYIITQDKGIDLYGFIYEELAVKSDKKESGEYYTPRHLIQSVLFSIYEKYLKEQWGVTNNKKDNYTIFLNKRILDPFCGSGGFLYEYLKLLKKEYGYKDFEINDIAEKSIIGFDINDIMAAYFNLFLIGDGRSSLHQVTTSINWQKYWRSKSVKKKDGKYKIIKIDEPKELKESIDDNSSTFKAMINTYIDFEQAKRNFSIDLKIHNVLDFIKFFENELNDGNRGARIKFFDQLMEDKYLNEEEHPVFMLMYDCLKKYSSNSEKVIDFSSFVQSLGTIDFLITNVPYGSINDDRFKLEGYGQYLESISLKECIDVLKPSSSKIGYRDKSGNFIEDKNGELISMNDGGIATIVVPNGIIERDEKARDYLFNKCKILSLIKLPFHTFSPYAGVQTYVITFQKKSTFEFNNDSQDQNVFFYIIDNDGKANSDKRFPTKLLTSDRTEIYNKKEELHTSVYEYLHDEIGKNIEAYPEGYLSKLERAWLHGNSFNVNENWNQKRYNQKWDGNSWGEIYGKKWGFSKLEKRRKTKQEEKKSERIKQIVTILLEKEENFQELDIENQRELIIKEIKFQSFNEIKGLKKKGNKISFEPEKGISNTKNIRSYILSNHNKDCEFSGVALEELKKNMSEDFSMDYVNKIYEDIEKVEQIDEIFIGSNDEDEENEEVDVKLFTNSHKDEYELLPEHYLGNPNTVLTLDYILGNFERFERMRKQREIK